MTQKMSPRLIHLKRDIVRGILNRSWCGARGVPFCHFTRLVTNIAACNLCSVPTPRHLQTPDYFATLVNAEHQTRWNMYMDVYGPLIFAIQELAQSPKFIPCMPGSAPPLGYKFPIEHHVAAPPGNFGSSRATAPSAPRRSCSSCKAWMVKGSVSGLPHTGRNWG
jgi:hypothetical protein